MSKSILQKNRIAKRNWSPQGQHDLKEHAHPGKGQARPGQGNPEKDQTVPRQQFFFLEKEIKKLFLKCF